ncbi:ATP-binding protein [Kitasatospora sp. NPDC058170]|uniref:ATP-binding protein n=1 Tax=Kitasatospora sp. NPDC058170 TaxID=3346364 RepID=UPI0036DDECA2
MTGMNGSTGSAGATGETEPNGDTGEVGDAGEIRETREAREAWATAEAAAAARWEDGNNAYLGAALHWLRLRLRNLVEQGRAEQGRAEQGGAEPDGPDHGRPGQSPATQHPTPPPSGPGGAGHRGLFGRRPRAVPPAGPTPNGTHGRRTPDSAHIGAHTGTHARARELALAAEARDAAAEAVCSAHEELARKLGLTAFEQDVLLLAAAREFDPAVDALSEAAGAGGRQPGPTFGLALRLFDQPAWDALSPERPLRRLHLVTLEGTGGLTARVLRADERVVNYLKGLGHLDERLAETVVPLDTSDTSDTSDTGDDGNGGDGGGAVRPSASQRAAAHTLRSGLVRTAAGGRPPAVNLVGPDTVSKQLLAGEVAAGLGRVLVRVPVAALPVQAGAAALVARLWERETLLAPLALYLDAGDEAAEAGPEAAAAVTRLLAQLHGPVFLDSREAWPHLGPGALVVDVAGPTTAEQRAVWADVLGPGGERLAGELAAQFDLDPVAIGRAALAVADDQAGGTGDTGGTGAVGGTGGTGGSGGSGDTGAAAEPAEELRSRVWSACLAVTRPRLDLLAQRLEVRARREDLVLPAEITEQLDRIRDQVRHRAVVYEDWGVARRTARGLGITALFAGESGTGKTTTAEVLARELCLDLYRIDLSAVMSKYIGETEKNLRRLFDAAERGGAILFFDEADALYGRRSEVKDSHDRYANVQVGYLLQRMEAYRGLAILATNMKGALDQAFTRRLRFVLDFPFPGPAEREAIWRRAFAPGVATDLDHARLARFGLAGGSIHNIAMNATFAAAGGGGGIGGGGGGRVADMPTVLSALRMECRKLGLVLDESEFDAEWEPAQAAAGLAAGGDGSRAWT